MNIWNKVLLGLIFIVSLGLFYISARTLKTNQYWRNLAGGYEYFLDKEADIQSGISEGAEFATTVTGGLDELAAFYRDYDHGIGFAREESWRDFEKKVLGAVAKSGQIDLDLLRACTFTTRKTPGVRRTALDLYKVRIGQGRVWYNCQAKLVDPNSGAVAVTPDGSDLSQISLKMTVFVFEEKNAENKGQYLGQFKVVGLDEDKKLVGMEPAMKMNQRERERLVRAKAGGPWTMYEIMPADNHAIFAGLSDDGKRAMLPEGTVEAYLMHGAEAKGEELAGCVVEDGKFVRRLRDYEVLFGEYHQQRAALADQVEAGQRDLRYATSAEADARKQVLFRQNDIDDLKKEMAQVENQRDAVAKHLRALKTKVADFQRNVEQAIVANRTMAARIARVQLEATRRIDERVRSRMAAASK